MRSAPGAVRWALSALFLGGCLCWVLTIPSYRRDLARLVPPQATLVARPRDLVAECPQWLANPALAGLLGGTSTATNGTAPAPRVADLPALLRSFAPGECALAYLPALGPGRDSAWLLVSWLGGQSQRLRWMLKSGRIPGAKRQFNRNGHLIWRLASRDLPPHQSLTLSVTEGMLVLCLSRDVGVIIEALDHYDGLRPAPPVRPVWPAEPVQGTQVVYQRLGAWTPTSEVWRGELARCDATHLELSGRGPWPDGWPVAAPAARHLDPWNPASANAVVQIAMDRELALFAAAHRWSDLPAVAGELVRRDAAGPLRVSVVDGPYAGRSRGLLLPTVLFGLGVISEPVVQARLGIMLDFMNRQYHWGLVRHDLEVGPYRPSAVEGTSDTAYARFALNEQLAWLVTNRTLVLASNTEGFTNLLRQTTSPVAAPPAPGEWAPDMVGDAWLNLREGGKSLRLLLTAWSLQLDERDRAQCDRSRRQIALAKAWVDQLAPLGSARIVVRREGPEMVVSVRAGDQP